MISIQNYSYNNLAIFDDEQIDLLLYQKIHDKFKSLVNALMQGFCDDLQIKAAQLFFALKHHDNSYKLSMKERIPLLLF
ncbi:hypothetical protein X798_00716 [Onchocerca flexuosa]|uniref:BART domain-containing protein n=1 Tax=Onchocerca flexuosa TaxID=387005 RepID=A0A238C4W7_9BILA|nr:hypothetical protein X798_00716 [Onchocerca flexuosa]